MKSSEKLTWAQSKMLKIMEDNPGRAPIDYAELYGCSSNRSWILLNDLVKAGLAKRADRACYIPAHGAKKDDGI